MLIKHLHYFSNSGGHNDIISLDQLKRSVSVKKQLYHLFKYEDDLYTFEGYFLYIVCWQVHVLALAARRVLQNRLGDLAVVHPAVEVHRGRDYGEGAGRGGGGRRGPKVADLHRGERGVVHGRAQAAATKFLQDGSHRQQERVHIVQDFQGERVWIDFVDL